MLAARVRSETAERMIGRCRAKPYRAEPPILGPPRRSGYPAAQSRKGGVRLGGAQERYQASRIGRRVLIRADVLLDWLRQKSTLSLER